MNRAEVDEVLDDPVARKLFAEQPMLRLAYTALDGSPRVVPIGYVTFERRIHVFTLPNAPKIAALRKDPRVAATIDAVSWPPKVLLLRGTAELVTVQGVADDYLDASRRVVPDESWDEFEAGVRGLYDEMVRIVITPTWAKIHDFETRLPQAVEELVRQKHAGG
jgi:hypothetical protein